METSQDSLILVNSDDQITGFATKEEAHRGQGLPHRAFSIFLFDADDNLLLHERSQEKPLWPGFWTNSCCSHPRRGEDILSAAKRRLFEELGVRGSLRYVYQFYYQAQYLDVGSENEKCSVLLARMNSGEKLNIDSSEISDINWMTLDEIDSWVSRDNDRFTPWFLLEWGALRSEYRNLVSDFLKS
tara:strand:+ start:136 stop:693 length:558 start_codon:yes stop_codon:yes gene_type:complete